MEESCGMDHVSYNLGLRSVGLMRQQTDEESEAIISKCNNMEQLRQAAKRKPALEEKGFR